jgi:hypothetical protein
MARIPILETVIAGEPIEAGLAVLELPAEDGRLPGIVIQPLIPPEVGAEIAVGANTRLRVRAGSDLAATLGIVIRPGGLDVRFPFAPGAKLPSAGFGVALEFEPEAPALLLGEPEATRLQVGRMRAGLELDIVEGELELRASVAPEELALVLDGADQDGFLAQLLGGPVTVPIPLAIEWSSRTGLTFSGSTDLSLSAYPQLALGPVRVDALELAVRGAEPPGLDVEAGLGLSGALGPVAFVLDDVGLRLRLSFAPGNAGPFATRRASSRRAAPPSRSTPAR